MKNFIPLPKVIPTVTGIINSELYLPKNLDPFSNLFGEGQSQIANPDNQKKTNSELDLKRKKSSQTFQPKNLTQLLPSKLR